MDSPTRIEVVPRRERARWRGDLPTERWEADERTYAALLDALTRDRLHDEAVEREMHATARRSQADVIEAQREAEREELAEARRELGSFREALTDLRARGGRDGQAEVPYRGADPREDDMADALVQYLVRPGYAEVRTEEPEPGRYVYFIRADWARLRALAEEIGHPLPG